MVYGLIIALGALAATLLLARSEGQKSAALRTLQDELKRREREQKKSEEINHNLSRLSDDDVRERLRRISRQ